MPKIIEILRLKYNNSKLSHQKIAQTVGLSKAAIGKYVSIASAVGIRIWPLPDGVDEAALGRIRMTRECHVRFWESAEVRFLCATRHPKHFANAAHATQWCTDYFDWYNFLHHHSGLNGYTSEQVLRVDTMR